MTNRELSAALRLCGSVRSCDECLKCPFFEGCDPELCIPKMTAACADALENHESHVLALRKEIETLQAQLTAVQSQNEQLREAAALTVKATTDRLCREWVSVKERLPSDSVDVLALVTGTHGNVTFERTQMIGTWLGKEGWFVGEYTDWDNPGVTHWMPLPEPPKEDA